MAAHQGSPSLGFSRQEHWSGFHFLLQCMKVKSEREVSQSCPTLRDPMDCSLPGSSVHGLFQARVLEWGAIAFSEKWARKLLWEEALIRPLILFMRVPSSRPSHLCQTPPTKPGLSEKVMAPTPVLLPGKSHGWRRLVGCSPWGREEPDTTVRHD